MSDYSSDSEDEYCYFTCDICTTNWEYDGLDYSNCNICDDICCPDCYIYRPDIFGMKKMKDKQGDCWYNCDVCITCEKKFENADEEEQKEIIKDMVVKHDEPDTDDDE